MSDENDGSEFVNIYFSDEYHQARVMKVVQVMKIVGVMQI